jgi:hypothetical protein
LPVEVPDVEIVDDVFNVIEVDELIVKDGRV